MGIADWLGMGKDPVLDALMQTYALKSTRRGQAQGHAHGQALHLSADKDGSGCTGIEVKLGECAMDPCFGFYRPRDEDFSEAVDFGPGWFESFQNGTPVRIGRFVIDFEGEPYWEPLIEHHGAAMAGYLDRYSQALHWVYLSFPGLSFDLREQAPGGWKRAADLKALERDIATSASLLEFVRKAAADEGVPPVASAY